MPHRKVEYGVLLKRSLDLKVLQLCNFFLDFVFLGDVGTGSGLRSLVCSHSCGLSPLGTDFARLIVCSSCNKFGVETISCLNRERGILLRKRWKVVLVRSSSVVIFLFLHRKNIVTAFLARGTPNGDSARLILVLGLTESQYRSLTLEGCNLSL